MAKKGKQGTLLDITPKNSKKIIAAAEEYQEWQNKRVAALAKEKEYKQEVLGLVKEAGLQPLPNGSIKFELDGLKITITPRDELVQVQEIVTPTD